MNTYLNIAAGGAAGAVLRYGLSKWPHSNTLPWHTYTANVIGSVFIGVLFALLHQQKINQQTYLLLAVGLCGGFTTFSSFSLENMQLLQEQQWQKFFTYSLLSVSSCIVGTFVGYKLIKALYP